MPFYEYECSNCKFYVEALQKISDPPMRQCPSCKKQTLQRLVSAPNFRLKGGGWYETDFKSEKEEKRNLAGREEAAETKAEPAKEGAAEAKDTAKPESKPKASKTTARAAAKPGAKPTAKPAKPKPKAKAKAPTARGRGPAKKKGRR